MKGFYSRSRSRKQRLADRGRQMFANPAEDALAVFLRDKGVACSKRGYPDFTVYDNDGNIYGFVEVKPRFERELKSEQKVFSEFCHRKNIPFLKWSPHDGEEPLCKFIDSILP